MAFSLNKLEDLSSVCAVWVSHRTVYETPYFEDVPVPVHIIDCNTQEIGTDGYPAEVDSFKRYCKAVKTLTAKILRCL